MSPSSTTARTASREERQKLLDRLKTEVRRLEGEAAYALAPPLQQGPSDPSATSSPSHQHYAPAFSSSSAEAATWTSGEAAFDTHLPGGCFDPTSLIELKPGDHGDWPTAHAFAACLAVRRLRAGERDQERPSQPVLWCTTSALAAEHGHLHGHGLAALGLAPETLISVVTARETDALWTLEEGLRSGGLSLVIGVLREAELTPSRRLGLAAAHGRTPALLLTLPTSAPAPSAAVRLRLHRLPSAPHPFDPRASGSSRIRLVLERCRRAPPAAETVSLDLEWCDVTYRFSLASGMGNRALTAPVSGERALG